MRMEIDNIYFSQKFYTYVASLLLLTRTIIKEKYSSLLYKWLRFDFLKDTLSFVRILEDFKIANIKIYYKNLYNAINM